MKLELIEERVDLENFIDYYCVQIYFANTDWPSNNIKHWKVSDGNGVGFA